MKNKFLVIFKNYAEIASTIYNALLYTIIFSFLFGATVLTAYIVHIKFLPFLNLEATFASIILCAIMGLMIAIFSFLALFFAPYLCRQLLKEPCVFKILVSDNLLYSKNNIRDEDFSAVDRIKIMIFYIVFACLGLNMLIALSYFGHDIFFKFAVLGGLIGGSIFPIFYSENKYITPKKSNENLHLKNKEIKSVANFLIISSRIILILLGATLSLTFGILLVTKIQDNDFLIKTTKLDLSTEKIIIFFSLISSFCVTSIRGKPYNFESLIISGFLMLAIALPTLNLVDNYCGQMIKFFKIGDMHDTSLIVNKEACKILSLGGYPITCNQPYQKIKKINILWRFGEYYVTYTVNKNGHNNKDGEVEKYSILPSNDAWLNDEKNR